MRLTAAVAIASLLPLTTALADVYRSVDAQGHVLYSDTPVPGAELVHTGVHHDSSPPPVATKAPPAAAVAGKSQQPAADPAAQEATARSVASDVAQTREQQCAKAKDEYQRAIVARRLYNIGPNGDRQYLSDDQAQQQRIAVKQAVDDYCGSASSQP